MDAISHNRSPKISIFLWRKIMMWMSVEVYQDWIPMEQRLILWGEWFWRKVTQHTHYNWISSVSYAQCHGFIFQISVITDLSYSLIINWIEPTHSRDVPSYLIDMRFCSCLFRQIHLRRLWYWIRCTLWCDQAIFRWRSAFPRWL